MQLLEVKDLKTYFTTSKGKAKAVDGVSFTLDYGQCLGLVGESGCGKTTTALSICQLLPKEGKVEGGQILLEGVDYASMTEEEIMKHRWQDVSIIFQGAMNAFNPVKKVGWQIAEACILHQNMTREQAWERAGELFEMVGIAKERVTQYPHEFSGGMKQRAMIAMALACSPKLIIGDEPTTALDVMIQAQILELLEKLRRELNMGMILITHDLCMKRPERRRKRMKNIVVCIGNGLLSEAIMNMLRSSGEFKPFRLLVQKKSHIASDCEAVAADILLLDVSYASGTTMETRLKEVKQVREKIPTCKLVMLCDENSAPDIAREVANAKKDGLIDAFFYSSVTEKYLTAALASL